MSLFRKASAGLAAATIALSAAACSSSSSSSSGTAGNGGSTGGGGTTTVKIMVGGLNKQIYLPAMLTQQLGYYQAAGLTVELSDEPAGVNAENAMLAGQVDGVVGFYDHNVDLQAKGKSTESVVQLLQAPGEVEMVRTDQVGIIKSPADFRGKHLGVTGLGSSTNFLTKALAVHAGVPVSEITSVPVEAGPTFIAAMEHKQIEAGMTTEPTITALLQKKLAQPLVDMRTLAATRQALGGTYPSSCLYLRSEWVAGHKDTTQKLVNAFVKTLKWINTHSPAEIADKMPPGYYAGVGKDAYVKALEAEKEMYSPDGMMPADGPKTVLDVLSSFSPTVKGHQIDLSKTYTNTFVQAAS